MSNADEEVEPTRNLSSPEPEGDVHALHDPIYREKARPRDGYQPIPLTLIFLFFGLLGWGGWYLGAFSGDWRVDIFYPGEVVERAKAAAAGPADQEPKTPEELRAIGERMYTQCAACHQGDGKGVAGNFPPLAGSDWVTGSPTVLARILLHGMEGPVEVLGETYNGLMPAWGEQMDDEQIAGVLTYIRSEWGNDAPPVEPALIGEVREATAGRTDSWSARELKQID